MQPRNVLWLFYFKDDLKPYLSSFLEAEKAQSVFNGRWFGGNCIIGEIYDEEKFNAGDLFG